MRWRRVALTVLIIAPILALLAYGFSRDARYITSPLLAKPATPFSVELFNGGNRHRRVSQQVVCEVSLAVRRYPTTVQPSSARKSRVSWLGEIPTWRATRAR